MKKEEEILENPITSHFRKSVKNSNKKILLAVPYISSFVKKLFDSELTSDFEDKRIITRFDHSNINTFNIPALSYLIDCGFTILINNNIHLKLYITDKDVYITSSNLTKGGFIDNDELTVKIDSSNRDKSENVFEKLWSNQKAGFVNKDVIKENWDKYNSLKRRNSFEATIKPKTTIKPLDSFDLSKLNVIELFDDIVTSKGIYDWGLNFETKANRKRTAVKEKLKEKGFDLGIFYLPERHLERNQTLFYDFVYGNEYKLAGTGLREHQFKECFTHKEFKNVIGFIYPESLGLKPWNLKDEKELLKFCKGLFSFDIPQYKVSLPIRLASFFHPDIFFPIYNLNHLKTVFEGFGNDTKAKQNWEKLFVYTVTFEKLLEDITVSLYAKSVILYQLHYALILHELLDRGINIDDAIKSFGQKWKQDYGKKAVVHLKNINALKS
ncbi:phospholipase D-like domain-containing protein [Tenacibaculum maritimum]|uniref:phospholipase D-like domain-containing protein n=1 Tax=Tenacibaculum maritimum TaxID=107401 RepID=UPI0012E53FB8|nr:phospholipase D-like domain-containing protein [Tenacibaculum maritimum]CAA0162206.1 conserved hypothetical protein [Tenacibaculum maritimum]